MVISDLYDRYIQKSKSNITAPRGLKIIVLVFLLLQDFVHMLCTVFSCIVGQ